MWDTVRDTSGGLQHLTCPLFQQSLLLLGSFDESIGQKLLHTVPAVSVALGGVQGSPRRLPR